MGISPQLARMKYVRSLQSEITRSIFEQEQIARNDLLRQIAEDNQMFLKANTPTFIFGELWYPEHIRATDVRYLKEYNRILHPDYKAKVQELFKVNFNDQEIQAGIKSLIGKVLVTAKHTFDLQLLLPSNFLYCVDIDPDVFDIDVPMTDDEIAAFKITNKKQYDIVKRLFITKLLLAKP